MQEEEEHLELRGNLVGEGSGRGEGGRRGWGWWECGGCSTDHLLQLKQLCVCVSECVCVCVCVCVCECVCMCV